MKAMEEALKLLIGREPTTDEVEKFYKVKEICGFSEHDSVWSLLLAFGHYEILYRDIPKSVLEQSRQLLAAHKDALEATATQAERHIKANLVDSVKKAAQTMANDAIEQVSRITLAKSRSTFVFAASLSIGVAALCIGLAGWAGFSAGVKSGDTQSAWASSNEGRKAREFSALNDTSAFMKCDEPGYLRRTEGSKVFCLPFDDRTKKITGWRIR